MTTTKHPPNSLEIRLELTIIYEPNEPIRFVKEGT